MPKTFIIYATMTANVKFIVEAKDEDEARKMVAEGDAEEVDMDDIEYNVNEVCEDDSEDEDEGHTCDDDCRSNGCPK